jgi:hypothetical protein
LQLEEERRLAYVGITRARRHLYVTHAWSRSLWGSTSHAIPSRFLSELPADLVRDVGASATSRPDPTRAMSAWSRRRARGAGLDAPGDEDAWGDAADSAHDVDAWHDPDPWPDDDDDAVAGRSSGPRPAPAAPRRPPPPAAERGPRRPAPPGRRSRLPKMAEERFRAGGEGRR